MKGSDETESSNMTTIHQFLSWLKERSKKNKNEDFVHFSSDFSLNGENEFLRNAPAKLPTTEEMYYTEQVNDALSVRATMKLPSIPREAMRLRKFVRYPRQTDSPHIYEEIAYEAMDKVQQTLALLDEQEKNEVDEMINVQNLDFTNAKEVGPYLVVPMKNKMCTLSSDTKNTQVSQNCSSDLTAHNDNHQSNHLPRCQTSSHKHCQQVSHMQSDFTTSSDTHGSDSFICCHNKHQNSLCNVHQYIDHMSQRGTCLSCSNLSSIVSTSQVCNNCANECNTIHASNNEINPHFKSILTKHERRDIISENKHSLNLEDAICCHQTNCQSVLNSQLNKTVSFCDSVREYPIGEELLSFSEKEFDALHYRGKDNGILVLKCDKHKRNDSILAIVKRKSLSESDSGNSSTYAYSGSDRENSLNNNINVDMKIPESDSSNDTFSEYDIRSGDESPHPEYDYFLSKAKHNLWLKHDVMRVIRESESSDYEGLVTSENESGSFTTVTSLSSDRSIFSEEDPLHDLLLKKLQKKRENKNHNLKKSCRATKDIRSSRSTENLEEALKLEQKHLNSEKNIKYACSKCNRIHSKREHCKNTKKKHRSDKSRIQEYYSLPDFVDAFKNEPSHEYLSDKVLDNITQVFSDNFQILEDNQSDVIHFIDKSNMDKLSCRATDYQPLSPVIKNKPNIYERVNDEELKNDLGSIGNDASSLISSLASSVYECTRGELPSLATPSHHRNDSNISSRRDDCSHGESTPSHHRNNSNISSRRDDNSREESTPSHHRNDSNISSRRDDGSRGESIPSHHRNDSNISSRRDDSSRGESTNSSNVSNYKNDSSLCSRRDEYSYGDSSSSSSPLSNYKNDSNIPARRDSNRLLSDIMKMNHDRQILFY